MSSTDSILVQVQKLISQGEAVSALEILKSELVATPKSAQLWQFRAGVEWQLGLLFDAKRSLEELIALNALPSAVTQLMQAKLACDLFDFNAASQHIEPLYKLSPEDVDIAITFARISSAEGNIEEAINALNRALSVFPNDARLIAARSAIPRGIDATWKEKALNFANDLSDQDPQKPIILLALARLLDVENDLDRAWHVQAKANTLLAGQQNIDIRPTAMRSYTQAMLETSNRAIEFYQEIQTIAPSASRPVYLIGPARSGSSLLQSILTAHSDVENTGERASLLPPLQAMCREKTPMPSSEMLTSLQMADIAGLEAIGISTPKYYIDKTPHNFFITPLLAGVHPNATFVNVQRSPGNVLISQLFYPFSTAFPETNTEYGIVSLLELRRTLSTTFKTQNLPVFDFNFDDFTASPNKNITTLVRDIDLPWLDKALHDPAARSTTQTFSAAQIRKPISRSDSKAWRRFQDFLDPEVFDRIQSLEFKVDG